MIHPINLSQSYFLETKGWHGVLVDPVPECCDLLRQHRPKSKVLKNALGAPEQRGSLLIRIPDGVPSWPRRSRRANSPG